ncbi:MAG: hypothetical protein V1688_00130 [bacterium]
MITLNLISPDYKKTIKIKKLLNDIENLFLYVMFIAIMAAIILLIARKILEDNFVEAAERTSLIAMNQAENKKNAQINKKIKLARQIQKDYIPWSRLIIIFSKLIPDNVKIDSFNVIPNGNKDEWEINLSGAAANRDDFLNFKKKLLEAKDLFDEKEIEIPMVNLLKKEKIDFDIKLKIKKNILTDLKMLDNY